MLGDIKIYVSGSMSSILVENYIQPKNYLELKAVVAVAIHKLGHNANLNWIDTSKVRSMAHLFTDTYSDGVLYHWKEDDKWCHAKVVLRKFNGDISRWDTSNVECMSYMFYKSYFNGDISRWDVRKVTSFEGMFERSAFNGNLNDWDVSGTTFNPLWDARPEGFYRLYTAFNNMFKDTSFNGSNIERWGEKLDERFKSATDMFTTLTVLSEERDHRGMKMWKQSTELFPSWYTPKN